MMVQFEQFGFVAPPHTAARWFLLGCKFAGLQCTQQQQLHHPPAIDHTGFVLSIVRHPLSWLIAYYNYRKVVHENDLIRDIPEFDTFESLYAMSESGVVAFILSYAELYPGAVSRMFDAYRPSSVMRFEDFPWSAVEYLHSLGVYETDQLAKAGDDKPHVLMKDRDLRRAVVKADKIFCDRCEYY